MLRFLVTAVTVVTAALVIAFCPLRFLAQGRRTAYLHHPLRLPFDAHDGIGSPRIRDAYLAPLQRLP